MTTDIGQPATSDAVPLQSYQTDVELAQALTTPAAFASPSQIHAKLRWQRKNQPVSLVETLDCDPFWLITKHADVLEIERQPDVFSNGARSTTLVSASMLRTLERELGTPHLTHSMVNMDGRKHREFRSLSQGLFMPGRVKVLERRIREIARTQIQRVVENGGHCDFVSDVALHYPLKVVMEILGVPENDEDRMLMLTQQLFGARDPEKSRAASEMSDPLSALKVFQSILSDFYDYFRAMTEDRRRNPRDDLATIIANARVQGEPMSDHEANSYYILAATAGHDTTSASIAGGLLALAQNPDVLNKVRSNPALIAGGLVDEAIRWTTPVKHFMRTAMQDYDMRGVTIRKGDWVMLSYMSANRDEEIFDRSEEFDIERSPNRQIAFGFGPHVCIGQHLARLEIQILFEELLPIVSAIELEGDPQWTQSVFISGPKHLPVKLHLS